MAFVLPVVGGVTSAAFGAGLTVLWNEVVKPKLAAPPPSRVMTALAAGGGVCLQAGRWMDGHRWAACGVVVGSYVCFRSRKLLVKGVHWLVPGYVTVKTAMGFSPPVEVAVEAKRSNCFESVRSGSEETKSLIPKSQVSVGEVSSGVFKAYGCGVRIGDYLVTPAHVVAHADKIALKTKKQWIELDSDVEIIELDTDLVCIKLGANKWSMLGVSAASVMRRLPMNGDYVSIVGVSEMGTTGTLRHDTALFGRVVYAGTTVAGYSGAGYYAAAQLSGVHTNGGAVNGGYSAQYIQCLLNSIEKIDDEESDAWLRKMFASSKTLKIDRRLEGGETRVFADGVYTTVKTRSLVAAFGDDWEMQLSGRGRNDYGDVHYESLGNLPISKSGASSVLVNSPDSHDCELQKLMKTSKQLSVGQLRAVRKLLLDPPATSDTQAK